MAQPFIKFFGSDWRSDPLLRSCSAASRGVWADCLSLMMECTPYGHLTWKGQPMAAEKFASLTVTPVAVVKKAWAEITSNDVCSLTEGGVMYSRRMVRDAAKQEEARRFGRQGGNPALKGGGKPDDDEGGITPQLTPPITPPDKLREAAGITQGVNPHGKPEARSTETRSSEAEAATDEMPWKAVGERTCELAGIDIGRIATDFSLIIRWLSSGFDPELDIYPTIMALRARPGYRAKSLNYFTDAIAEARKRRLEPTPDRPPNGSHSAATPLTKSGAPPSKNIRVGSAEDIAERLEMGIITEEQAAEERARIRR